MLSCPITGNPSPVQTLGTTPSRFRRVVPSRFAARLGAVQLGFHFGQVFFDFPSYLNLGHRMPYFVIGRFQRQPC